MYEVSINGDFGKSKKNSIKGFLSQNKRLVFLSLCLLLGIFCGSILIKFADENTLKLIKILFSSDIQERAAKSNLDFLITSLSSTFLFLVIPFFIGLSLYGFVFAPFVPFLRGFCIGMSEVYLYSSHGLKGLCFHSLIFLPGIFVSSLAILLASQEAFRMSNKLSTLALSADNLDVSFELKRYFVRSGCIVILAVVSAVVDIITNSLMTTLFGT